MIPGVDPALFLQEAGRCRIRRSTPAQKFLLESVRVGPDEGGAGGAAQADRWATNLAAAQQFHAREGHLTVPRKHVEEVDGTTVRLGSFLDNTRRRATKLTEQRRADLDQLGMRW
ncbi:helicase associated domain-containing protein [Streptomyces sp. NPDC093675]|uniref:helicase associated domain-containing protein n=1 Tax=Streptomyces sp. NPDC093675 TaxID=3366049 RepID=UPI00382B585A